MNFEQTVAAEWRTTGASVTGTSHVQSGAECADAHFIECRPAFMAMAVADGAGSASSGKEGAEIAIRHVRGHVSEREAAFASRAEVQEAVRESVFSTAKEVAQVAFSENRPVSLYATTLSLAIVTSEWIALGHIGDGSCVVRTTDDELIEVLTPQKGEYANQTFFLTGSGLEHHLFVAVVDVSVQSIALRTDGLEPVTALGDGGAFLPFYKGVFSHFLSTSPDDVQTFSGDLLHSEPIRAQCSDDLTLIVADRGTHAIKT